MEHRGRDTTRRQVLNIPSCDDAWSNPDMQGFAVRLATFLTNVCLAILMTWSRDDIETAVQSLLSLCYSVLAATFLSIGRKQLTVSDASFALTATHSPLALYLIYTVIADLISKKDNGLLERLGASRIVIRAIVLLLVPFWLVLDLIIVFAGQAFINSSCSRISFKKWVYRLITSTFLTNISIPWQHMILLPIFIFIVVSWLFLSFLVRGDISNKIRSQTSNLGSSNILRKLMIFPRAIWTVVTRRYPWLKFAMAAYTYYGWFFSLGLTDVNDVALKVVSAETSEIEEIERPYELSYGQLLALSIAIPPLLSVLKLVFTRRADLDSYLRKNVRHVQMRFRGRKERSRTPSSRLPRPVTMPEPNPPRLEVSSTITSSLSNIQLVGLTDDPPRLPSTSPGSISPNIVQPRPSNTPSVAHIDHPSDVEPTTQERLSSGHTPHDTAREQLPDFVAGHGIHEEPEAFTHSSDHDMGLSSGVASRRSTATSRQHTLRSTIQ